MSVRRQVVARQEAVPDRSEVMLGVIKLAAAVASKRVRLVEASPSLPAPAKRARRAVVAAREAALRGDLGQVADALVQIATHRGEGRRPNFSVRSSEAGAAERFELDLETLTAQSRALLG